MKAEGESVTAPTDRDEDGTPSAEARVAELEAALAAREQELARAREEAEQLAYVASHDLQEPLRMVNGFATLLSQRYGERLDDKGREFLGYLVDGAERMQVLIEDLLAWSRVARRCRPRATSVGAALRGALEQLHEELERTGGQVTHDELPRVTADPEHLQTLFRHLLDNAIKFHGDAAPRIHVSVERDGPMWCVTVEDQGEGFDPRFAERVFKIFQRLHPRDAYPGTGIGLALCKRIVECAGGRIAAKSAPGEGTAVRFTLPAAEA